MIPLVALTLYNDTIIFNLFMHDVEKWPNIHKKPCGVCTKSANFERIYLSFFSNTLKKKSKVKTRKA